MFAEKDEPEGEEGDGGSEYGSVREDDTTEGADERRVNFMESEGTERYTLCHRLRLLFDC